MSIVDASTLHASAHVASNAWISFQPKIYKDKKNKVVFLSKIINTYYRFKRNIFWQLDVIIS
jgi:hypothetical protein